MWLTRQLQPPRRRDQLFSSFLRPLLTTLRLFSPSAGGRDAPQPPAERAHFMVDYLVSNCELSSAEALRASKCLTHIKSREKPDNILRFLRQERLGDSDIRRAVLRFPKVLLADAKKTLEPKIRALQGAGFSESEIAQLIATSPMALLARDLLRRVEFWRKLLGTNRDVLRTLKKQPTLLSRTLDKVVIPRISLLLHLGVPELKMRALVLARPMFVLRSPGWVASVVDRTRSLGFSPGTPVFVEAMSSISNLSRSTLDAKSEHLKSFGWTEAEFTSAIRKYPSLLRYSKKRISTAMGFFLQEARWKPSYIARNPSLVGYNMEKRLIPRLHVLQFLKAKGLLSKNNPSKAMQITEDSFVLKYVAPYGDELPGLLEVYRAGLARKAQANTTTDSP